MWYIIYILNDYIRLISKHIRNLANTVHHSEQSKKKKKKKTSFIIIRKKYITSVLVKYSEVYFCLVHIIFFWTCLSQ